LRVLDPARRAGVLSLRPDGELTLFQITCVIQDQHAVRVAERVGDVAAHVVTHALGVPDRLTQQPLHCVRRRVSGLLRHLPTRSGVHIGQQAEQKRTGPPARLHPAEPARDRHEPGVELGQPFLDSYAVPSGRLHARRHAEQPEPDRAHRRPST
jgi:hypothetical protein